MSAALIRHPALKRWPILPADRLPMALWDAATIAAITTGKASGDFQVSGIDSDSRDIRNGDLFVALQGEAMDGHRFLDKAFANGAIAALVDRPVDYPHVLVEDTTAALNALAAAARERTFAKVVGVTGSVGAGQDGPLDSGRLALLVVGEDLQLDGQVDLAHVDPGGHGEHGRGEVEDAADAGGHHVVGDVLGRGGGGGDHADRDAVLVHDRLEVGEGAHVDAGHDLGFECAAILQTWPHARPPQVREHPERLSQLQQRRLGTPLTRRGSAGRSPRDEVSLGRKSAGRRSRGAASDRGSREPTPSPG